MKKMRSFVTLLAIIILSLSVAVPVHASSKVAEWHTDEFKETYAKMKENEAWKNLDESVRKQINNYARSNKDQAGSILIMRSIDMEVYSKKQQENEETIIGKLMNLLSSKEFQTYLILTELAKYDGIEVRKDLKGIYHTYEIDIPPLPAE